MGEMETLGFIFGLMGMSMGSIGFVFGIIYIGKFDNLVNHLKEKGIIDKDYNFEY